MSRAQVRGADFLAGLRRILSDDAVLASDAEVRPYECDALTTHCELPGVVVLPHTREQVQALMVYCRDRGVPIVPRGAGTGLSGGAMPRRDGVLLGMSRFTRILDLDPLNRCARVEPGVRNLAISEAAAGHGLFFAPDPSSQFASSIGGNVAENSGGVHCVKYGLTTHNLLEITFITMDGELVTIGGPGFDGPGYDLMAAFTGSEGMLGIVVEVLVRLLPIPRSIVVVQAAFPTMESAGQAVMDIIGAGIIPAGIEIMDKVALGVVESYIRMGLPTDAEALILCELDGSEAEVNEQMVRTRNELEKNGAYRLEAAWSKADRERLWWGRKAAFPAMGRVSSDFYIMDATVPRKALSGVLQEVVRLGREYGMTIANTFHAGDGNLHPVVMYDASDAEQTRKTHELASLILDLCLRAGGTVTGEHGIGAEKLDKACAQFAAAELKHFFALKRAFDPHGLLNPGKAIPTLTRCAELGGTHIHGGALPMPQLERF